MPFPSSPAVVTAELPQFRLAARRRLANWLADPLQVGFAMLLAGAALAPLNSIRVTGAVIAADLPMALAALALFAGLVTRRQQLWLLPGLLVVLALGVISLFGQEHDQGRAGADAISWTILMFCMVGIPLLFANAPGASWPRLTLLFKIWLLGSSFGALVCVLQSRGISLGPLNQWLVYQRPRYAGFNLHPNILAMASALAFPGCALLAATARRWRAALGWAACGLVCLWSINLSGSRAGLVAPMLPTALILSLYLGYQHMSRSAALRIALGALVLLLALTFRGAPADFEPVGQSAFERLFVDDRTGAKADSVREAQHFYSELRFETKPILGNGWGSIQFAEVHYLSLMESGGALGLLMGIVQQLLIAWAALLALMAHARDPERAKVVLGLIAAWLTFIAMGFKHPLLLERDCYVPMGLLLLASRLRHVLPADAVPATDDRTRA